jgi:hypothetical protein
MMIICHLSSSFLGAHKQNKKRRWWTPIHRCFF